MTNTEKAQKYDILNKYVRKLLKATNNVSDADKLLALDGFKVILLENDICTDIIKKDKSDFIQISLKRKEQ